MTRDFGGRLYPAKDAAMTADQFQAFYPQWEHFARFRDPMLTSSFWERVTGDAVPHYEYTAQRQSRHQFAASTIYASKKILVLGATSGIAEATCRIWAAQGASLFLVARNPEKLAAVAADLQSPRRSPSSTPPLPTSTTPAKHPELLAHAINSLHRPRHRLSRPRRPR